MGLIRAFDPEQVVAKAREWIGTPYHHQQVVKGKTGGCDCVGLIIGVHDELYQEGVGHVPEYTPWWAEETGQELMVEIMRDHRHCIEVSPDQLQPGDIFVMRMKYKGPAKHCGFMSYDGQIIHAYSGHDVIESDIPPGWEKRIVYAFRFGREE